MCQSVLGRARVRGDGETKTARAQRGSEVAPPHLCDDHGGEGGVRDAADRPLPLGARTPRGFCPPRVRLVVYNSLIIVQPRSRHRYMYWHSQPALHARVEIDMVQSADGRG